MCFPTFFPLMNVYLRAKFLLMLKIGVLGAGHLGNIHIKLIREIPDYTLVGFYDPNPEKSREVAETYGITAFSYLEELIAAVDVVDIVTPTLSHYDCAVTAIRHGKHIFIEKPLTNTLQEAKSLLQLVEEANIKGQVGHVERFNPAYLSLQNRTLRPMFIETHRLAQFNPRGTDVSVVLDLMIHDLDIVLSMVKANVKKVSASGVAVVSNTPDIANARIEFDNGCVANLTASRISLKNMRKTRLFQKDAYISIDFMKKVSQIVTLEAGASADDPLAIPVADDEGTGYKKIQFEEPDTEPVNAIKMELETFADSILQDKPTRVSIEDGYRALELAHRVLDQIEQNNRYNLGQ